MKHSFDAVLVGAVQAAPSLAAKLAKAGMRIAFVERSKFGGTCVNNGCMPTKTWVASARAMHVARRGTDWGVQLNGSSITANMERIQARKHKVVSDASTGVEDSLRSLKGCTVFQGTARFEDPHTLRVGDDQLEAERIFLNVGARASVPPIEGLRDAPYLTNSSVLELQSVPEHLVILGGSYIALEFAQIFRRFGSEVTVIQRGNRLLTREDEDVARSITEILEGEGIRVILNGEVQRVTATAEGITAHVNSGDVSGSHLLLALGRTPNTGDLGLNAAGVTVDAQGYISVDDHLQTSMPHIWALGDCNGRGAFTHTSYNDFEIVAANLLDGEDRKVSDRISTYAIFIDPPLGRAGMTEQEVRKSGRAALKAVRPMTNVGRAVEKGETLGFMKILVDAETKQILGCSLLGVEGDEVIHSVLDTMYARKPFTLLTHAVHIHPTVSELIPTLLEDLQPL